MPLAIILQGRLRHQRSSTCWRAFSSSPRRSLPLKRPSIRQSSASGETRRKASAPSCSSDGSPEWHQQGRKDDANAIHPWDLHRARFGASPASSVASSDFFGPATHPKPQHPAPPGRPVDHSDIWSTTFSLFKLRSRLESRKDQHGCPAKIERCHLRCPINFRMSRRLFLVIWDYLILCSAKRHVQIARKK